MIDRYHGVVRLDDFAAGSAASSQGKGQEDGDYALSGSGHEHLLRSGRYVATLEYRA